MVTLVALLVGNKLSNGTAASFQKAIVCSKLIFSFKCLGMARNPREMQPVDGRECFDLYAGKYGAANFIATEQA